MAEKVVIGDAELWLGDCREILPTLPNVDAVVTDPPYNAGLDYGPLVNDVKPWSEYACWLSEIIEQLEAITDGPIFCFVSVNGLMELIPKKRPRHICVWDKPLSFSCRLGGSPFLPHWEPCAVFGRVWGEAGRVPNWHLPDVWHHNPAKRNGHPCPKPHSVLAQIIGASPAHLVLDPFMGSGTTGIACANLGRKFIGIEIEPKYFDIACERIAAAYAQGRLFA